MSILIRTVSKLIEQEEAYTVCDVCGREVAVAVNPYNANDETSPRGWFQAARAVGPYEYDCRVMACSIECVTTALTRAVADKVLA